MNSRLPPISSDIGLANEDQKLAIIEDYSEVVGKDMSKIDSQARGRFLHADSEYLRKNLVQWYVLHSHMISNRTTLNRFRVRLRNYHSSSGPDHL